MENATATATNNVLAAHLKLRTDNTIAIAKKGFIDLERDCFYMVVSGIIMVRENEGLARIHKAEEIFGCGSFLSVPTQTNRQATALEDATVVKYLASEIKDMAQRNGPLAVAVIEALATETQEAQIVEGDIMQRVAKILVAMARRFGTTTATGMMIQERWLTQECISWLVGTSREIVTAKFNTLRNHGIINYKRSTIAFVNAGVLQEIADGNTKLELPATKKKKKKK